MTVATHVSSDGRVHRATLNRPERLNALDASTVDELHDSIALAAREGARAWLLHGAGRSFCAGFDLRQSLTPRESAVQISRMQQLTSALRAAPFVSIAAVHGNVVGGGFELALACDVIVAASDAELMFPDVNNAFAVGGGATYLLPRLVGLARAPHLLLTGDPVSGAAAHDAGMVAVLSDDAESVLADGLAMAERLAASPHQAVTTIRRAIDRGLSSSLDASLDAELADQLMTFDSDEGRSTVDGFGSTRP